MQSFLKVFVQFGLITDSPACRLFDYITLERMQQIGLLWFNPVNNF